MCEDRKQSTGQWASWIDDPDPPEEPMTDEQLTAFVKGIKELLSDPNRKEPVDPFPQPPAKTLEHILEDMRKHQINMLMRDYPTMTRARAMELVELDFPYRTLDYRPAPQRPVILPPPTKTSDQIREELVSELMSDDPQLTREEAEKEVDAVF
jgi:hypothetical protein